jgi:hypothetical protein
MILVPEAHLPSGYFPALVSHRASYINLSARYLFLLLRAVAIVVAVPVLVCRDGQGNIVIELHLY